MKLTKDGLDRAYDYFELALQKDPNYALAYTGIAGVWTKRNQMTLAPSAEAIPNARVAVLKALEIDDNLSEAHLFMASVHAWGNLADEQAALHDKGMDSIDIADSYVLRGDNAKALDWIEKAYEEHNPMLPYISCFPRCDPLRSEPRFQALLRRMGIPVNDN